MQGLDFQTVWVDAHCLVCLCWRTSQVQMIHLLRLRNPAHKHTPIACDGYRRPREMDLMPLAVMGYLGAFAQASLGRLHHQRDKHEKRQRRVGTWTSLLTCWLGFGQVGLEPQVLTHWVTTT